MSLPAPAPPEQRDDRLPALDGVRGIAILVVVIHHCCLTNPAGPVDEFFSAIGRSLWFGVDLFFVLSGFLITGILRRTRSAPNYFSAFYMRRVLRIFPLYYTFLFVLMVALPLAGVKLVHDHHLWFLLFGSNLLIAFDGWQAFAINPTWSLAIEEQFYLVWPLLVLLLRRRALFGLLAGAVVLGFIIRTWTMATSGDVVFVYMFTPARLDGLAMGAALALLSEEPAGLARWRKMIFAAGSVAAFGLLALFISDGSLYFADWGPAAAVLLSPLTALAGGAVVLLAFERGSQARGLLCARPLLVLGKYSFALYLIHSPVIYGLGQFGVPIKSLPAILGSTTVPIAGMAAVVLAMSLGLAMVSWYTLERPFLRLKKHFRYQNAPVSRGPEAIAERAPEGT